MFKICFMTMMAIFGGLVAPGVAPIPPTVPVASIKSQSQPTRIGMNLAANTYYATEFPFIDRMRSAGDWIATGATEPIELTAEGFPARIPAGAKDVYTIVGLDPHPGDYVLTYEGGNGFFLAGAQIKQQTPGRITFHYDAPGNQMLVAAGNVDGLRNVRIFRADHEQLLAAGEIFNPEFVRKIGQFDTLRYMDWINTNATNVAHWADRTTPSYRTWQTAGNSSMPIEIMVALANKTRTNMWLNVPTKADDDYVRQMMVYVRDNLDPALSVHVEYSNEVWNWGFQQSGYAHVEAAKLWGIDANRDGRIDPYNQAEQYGLGWVTWYGYRSAQIARIALDTLGSRAMPVLATQTVYMGLENSILDGVSRSGLGKPSDLFREYAVTTYFDGMLRAANEVDRATVLSWARGGDAGMTAAFAALRNKAGLTAKDEGSLAFVAGIYAYQGNVARQNGLRLVAYEGGIDLSTALGSQGEEVAALFRRMQADPRMGPIYTEMASDFSAAGGTLLNPLIDVDAGLFGTLKSIYDTGSPAWDALVAAQKQAKAEPPPPAASRSPGQI